MEQPREAGPTFALIKTSAQVVREDQIRKQQCRMVWGGGRAASKPFDATGNGFGSTKSEIRGTVYKLKSVTEGAAGVRG